MAAAVKLEEVRRAQRAVGPATVLAIGTAVPANCVYQATYPDYYFRVTKSEHLSDLKEKFERMCEKSTIRKRHMHLTEDILKKHPSICSHMEPSLNTRHDIVAAEVPKLGKEAAERAIKEWGQPLSKITHVIFCTTSGVDMPGADYQLTRLLGLSPTVKRLMMYQQGCFGGATVLRMAKDIAENNRGAPAIIGADLDEPFEKPLFQLVSASQTILPESEGAINGHLTEAGLTIHLLKDVPGLISQNIEQALEDAFKPLGIHDWNSIFWIAHPGGPAILDMVEEKVGLDKERMRASREVLSEYGNMSSACVLFVLDVMRKTSSQDGHTTTGEGKEWGVLFGFGPGLTVETLVLYSAPIIASA
ncbi:hypothetical protein ZWY2020_054454 [Hordeum vulgare]|nr:hypothetical protein ZWY2020_054454 [Hordeum vulgare]